MPEALSCSCLHVDGGDAEAREHFGHVKAAEAEGFAQPTPTIDIDSRLRGDPYFDKSGIGDQANNRFWNYKDFNKWTPGLERMFAPTMDNRAWF